MPIDVSYIRPQFPALREQFNGSPAIFFDNPSGTQVPQRVVDAMTDYLIRRNANVHSTSETSRRTDETVTQARQASADFLNCAPDEVVFGSSMTSLAFQLSHSLRAEFGPADEIVVTRLDHEANIAPWTHLAQDTGATLHFVDINPETSTLDMDDFQAKLNPRTKLVAVGYASNATGTINDVATVIAWAKQSNAYTFVDAVQLAPHQLIDVKQLDCDFLACSAYKFFGPHVGLLYGKREHFDRLRTYQVRPASDQAPGSWERGTKNHEGLAGVKAAIDYIANVGVEFGRADAEQPRRQKLVEAFKEIAQYEETLTRHLISSLLAIPTVRIYGITEREALNHRVGTVSLRKQGTTPRQLAEALAAEQIFVTNGNFYALSLTERLSVEMSGGLLRLGIVHYNTLDEIDRCVQALDRVS